jgi:DNA-directed RNA polymerase subunit K/omega
MPYMTKFEFVTVVSSRAQQIADGGASDRIDSSTASPLAVAVAELSAGVMPLKIHRVLPDGSEEVWSCGDLHVPSWLLQHAERVSSLR